MTENSILPFITAFMEPDWLRAVISSVDFRVGLEILIVPYGELFFVAPTGSDWEARAGSMKSRKTNDSASRNGARRDFCAPAGRFLRIFQPRRFEILNFR